MKHRQVLRVARVLGTIAIVCGIAPCAQADDAQIWNNLSAQFNAQFRSGQFNEAESIARRMLAIAERSLANQPVVVTKSLFNLACACARQSRDDEAEALYKRGLAIVERVWGAETVEAAIWLEAMAAMYVKQPARPPEAGEALFKRALRIREHAQGPLHDGVATDLRGLAFVMRARGNSTEAEPYSRRVLEIEQKLHGLGHPHAVEAAYLLSGDYCEQGKYSAGEQLIQQVYTLHEQSLGPRHLDVAKDLGMLADFYTFQGRYAEAESLRKRSLSIKEANLPPEDPEIAVGLSGLGQLYEVQGRYDEAEPLYRRALELSTKRIDLGRNAIYAELPGDDFRRLGQLYTTQGRFAAAEPLLRRALAMGEQYLGPRHPFVALVLMNLANMYKSGGRLDQAEEYYKRALKIQEQTLGSKNPHMALGLYNLALVYAERRRFAEAGPMLDRAIAVFQATGYGPRVEAEAHQSRAQIAWLEGHREDALKELSKALELAERERTRASGAEQEQAIVFGRYATAYEQMVAWQLEIGDLGQAFSAMERGRARSLVEQIDRRGVDLLAGIPTDQAQTLRERETRARSLVSQLEKQLDRLAQRRDLSLEEREQRAESLRQQLSVARQAYVDAYRDIRNASPAFRLSLTSDHKPVTLDGLREWAAARQALVVEHMVTAQQSFVVVVPPANGRVRIEELSVASGQATKLGIDAGPLTAKRLERILIGSNGNGVVARLADPSARAEDLTPRLFALWQVLMPEPERKAIQAGGVKRVVVLPDGPLALLPFEALVVEEGKDPQYLLDAGPPIVYGPSATVLHNLAERARFQQPTDREPVLSVADPDYGEVNAQDPRTTSALATLTPRSRYGGAGGKLSRLPYSGTEMKWVAQAFQDAGIKAVSLDQATATERGVRYWSSGRRVLHLACHGLADAKHGNFFGSLALTPGPKVATDPSDDGFLTLPEIYELNLTGCELAILSACQTNYGPQQKGEGTWALSRGFLVAGARRVVASNWLVDDEAAASLVSRFCGGLAQAEKAGKTVDYAGSLQEAKRWVRKQEKWRSPYYWASLVLVGPP
jgi:CHAT domain-containing protein